MGDTSNAILAYGYDLGGGHQPWNVAETGEYGALHTPWYDPEADIEEDPDDDERRGAFEAMIEQLYCAIPDVWPLTEVSTEREKAVEAHYGVSFVSHGDRYNWPQPKILAAHAVESEYGQSEALDLVELQARGVAQGWDERLQHVLGVLGLHPLADRPTWVLASVEA